MDTETMFVRSEGDLANPPRGKSLAKLVKRYVAPIVAFISATLARRDLLPKKLSSRNQSRLQLQLRRTRQLQGHQRQQLLVVYTRNPDII